MHRDRHDHVLGAARSRTARVLAAATTLAAVLVPLTGTGPASAATAAHLRVRDATVEMQAPATTRPMDDDCFSGWSGQLCGLGLITVYLTGFDAFGGIPSCDPDDADYSDSCEDPVASLVETTGTRVAVVVRCEGQRLPRVRSIPVTTERSHLTGPSDVSAFNRLDSDSARVQILFYLPTPAEIGACGSARTDLLGAFAYDVTVGWNSEESAGNIPAGTARIGGVHRVRL